MAEPTSPRDFTAILAVISEKLGGITERVERLQAHMEGVRSVASTLRDEVRDLRSRFDREVERRDDITGRITILEGEAKQSTTFRTRVSGGWMIVMAAIGLATGIAGIVSFIASRMGK